MVMICTVSRWKRFHPPIGHGGRQRRQDKNAFDGCLATKPAGGQAHSLTLMTKPSSCVLDPICALVLANLLAASST